MPPQSVSMNTAQLVGLCATGLLICFFLPWVQILFGKPSGFDLARQGDHFYLFWALPFFCVVTTIAGFTKNPVKIIAQITGCLPFGILIWGLSQVGSELLKALEAGAYGSLALGVALLVLPRNIK